MTLSPETKNRYTLAIMELATTLTVDSYTPVDLNDFCERHSVKLSFFDALRDLDVLVYDLVRDSGYQRTPALSVLTPEQVVARMRGQGGKKRRDEGEDVVSGPDELILTTHKPDSEAEPKNPVKYRKPFRGDQLAQFEPSVSPPLPTRQLQPYTIHISSPCLELQMSVATGDDAKFLSDILGWLNR